MKEVLKARMADLEKGFKSIQESIAKAEVKLHELRGAYAMCEELLKKAEAPAEEPETK